ncbi:hypothetical protein [Erythrobacter sanguineus]|nr:hypothetical protein [Erythrobacter sanguineus]
MKMQVLFILYGNKKIQAPAQCNFNIKLFCKPDLEYYTALPKEKYG